MHRRLLFSRLVAPLALTALVAAPGTARAANVEAARGVIDGMAAQALAVLRETKPGSPDRLQRLASIFERNFDLQYLAQLAVGNGWRQLDAADKARFSKVFATWVVRTQSARLGQYAGERLEVSGASAADERDSIINSTISGGTLAQPVKVDWRVRDSASPKIIDVVVAGVSMVVTYRGEFQPIVQQRGLDGLIAELESRAG